MENSQKVRHIPIFVEGRDEPIINKDHGTSQTPNNPNTSAHNSSYASAESSAPGGSFQQQNPYFQNQNQHNFGQRNQVNFNDMDDMGFGDMPMPGSIFERAKDFPVRTDFPDIFSNVRSGSPRRSESPNNNQPKKSSSGSGQATSQNLKQSGSSERPIFVHHENMKRSSTPQRQQTPPRQQNQQVPSQEVPKFEPQLQPSSEENAATAKQKAIEDSITKIQKIQQSVLDLMSSVENHNGTDRKEYLYLDEMLTQNLLKLDDIDAEGKDNIKNARREAIKCINSLISLLEAKKDAAKAPNNENEGVQKIDISEKTKQTEAALDQNLSQNHQPIQDLNGVSKNSSYENVNQVHESNSTNSVKMINVPEKSAETILEQKIAEAISKQDEKTGQKQT